MIDAFDVAPLDAVRHLIAAATLGADEIEPRLGEIELRPHQLRAASRLAMLIATNGGAMLAEPVGVGKTYTALAVAARCSGSILAVAPASLGAMWEGAATRCALSIEFASHEALSRGRSPKREARFVIVDEAHRVRTTSTKRYALLAEICRRAEVLLVTATPVQNTRLDLATQLALFLGRSAWSLTEEQLAEHIVRDSGSILGARPRLDGPHRVSLDIDDDCLDDMLALPPPVPAAGESVVAALLTYGLIHQWTSSRAALVAALKRRRSRGLALMSALEAGRRPTRAELSAWTHAGDALQLAFPEIVASDSIADDVDGAALREALERHGAAVESLLRHLRDTPDPDSERADALRRIRDAHPGARIIAFCQYAETVGVLRAKLSREPGVAALTAAGARVAGGKITRDDILAQFAPGGRSDSAHHISLLITTDLLSEGLNLQEASVIVHLDLPWNPARLDQRVGRALRLGSRHSTVTVYAIAPPAPGERILRIEARLREKLSVAQRTVGIAGRILPSPLGGPLVEQGLAEQRSAFDRELRRWLASPPTVLRIDSPIVAAVQSDFRGFLALVRSGRGSMLVADAGGGIDTSAATVARAIAASGGIEARADVAQIADTQRSLGRWLALRRGADTVDLNAASAARARRAALTRVAQALARTPRHQRSRLAPLADAARAVASAPLAEGAERILETLVRAELPDEAWLRSIATFGALNARPQHREETTPGKSEVIAVILLAPRAT